MAAPARAPAKAWPGLTVEESSLRVQVATLRKALGGGRGANTCVVNSAGRGHSFVGRVTWHDPPQETATASIAPRRRETGLPRRPSRMLGRDADLGAISELLAAHRFVTVHGPGGMGKRPSPLAVAHEQAQAFRNGVRFLDLGLRGAHDKPKLNGAAKPSGGPSEFDWAKVEEHAGWLKGIGTRAAHGA